MPGGAGRGKGGGKPQGGQKREQKQQQQQLQPPPPTPQQQEPQHEKRKQHNQQNGTRRGGGGGQEGTTRHMGKDQREGGPPHQVQMAHNGPRVLEGVGTSLSLAQYLGQVLSSFSGSLASEQDVDARMLEHPLGANWRSCLEVMVEQSVRFGALHPECPDIRLSVHSVATPGVRGEPSQIIMVSHPAAAPFKFYCDGNRQAGSRSQLQESWLKMSPPEKRPYEEQAAAMRGLTLPLPWTAEKYRAESELHPPAVHHQRPHPPPPAQYQGQQSQQNHQHVQRQHGMGMFAPQPGLEPGRGDEHHTMSQSALPPQWAVEYQQQQQQHFHQMQPAIGGMGSSGIDLDLNMLNMQRDMARMGIFGSPGGQGASSILQKMSEGVSKMQGGIAAAPGQNGPDSMAAAQSGAGQNGLGGPFAGFGGFPGFGSLPGFPGPMGPPGQAAFAAFGAAPPHPAGAADGVDGHLLRLQQMHAQQMPPFMLQQMGMQARQMNQQHAHDQQAVNTIRGDQADSNSGSSNGGLLGEAPGIPGLHGMPPGATHTQHLGKQVDSHFPQQQQQQQQKHHQERQQNANGHSRKGGGADVKGSGIVVKESASAVLKQKLSDGQVCAISDVTMKVFGELVPQDDEMQARQDICNKLQRAVQMQWPSTRLVLFGSSGNNLCTKGSDLDLCLHVPSELLHPNESQHRRGGTGGRDRERQQKQRQRKNLDQFLLKLAVLLRNGGMIDVEPITTARVPIVKFKVRDGIASTLECDLCINNTLACHNTELIYAFTMLDWRVRPLVYCIKLWAKRRKIHEPYKGYLSSYSYTLMVIHYLQREGVLLCLQDLGRQDAEAARDPVLRVLDKYDCYFYRNFDALQGIGESTNGSELGVLLVGFFYFYARLFPIKDAVISVRKGDMLSKKEKGWDKPKERNRHVICIEDPFDVEVDLGRYVDEETVQDIKQELNRAVEVLLQKGDLDEVLKEWTEDEVADPATPGSGLQRSGSKEPLNLEEEEDGDGLE